MLRLAVLVSVDLLRHGQPGVAEDQLRIAGGDTKILEQRGSGVPKVMKLDHPRAAGLAEAMERTDEVTRLDRPSGPGGEDEPVVLPGPAQLVEVGGLRLAADAEHVGGEGKHRQLTAASAGLDRADPQLTVDAPDLLADADLRVL